MAFAVVCKSCQARFLLNDDLLRRKVAGKVVTVRCRQCHATIEVDASDVDPQAMTAGAKTSALPTPTPEPPGPPPMKALAFKPAPAPPRPTKSATLMGIGGPPRPAGATELVALSPGFLSVSAVKPAPPAGARGFPEPPPPPGAIEDLSSGDWEVTETLAMLKPDAAPESVDDFIEELPPSLPPSAEEALPSSTGTPSLKALTHHDDGTLKPRADDFLANMSAAMNGGILASPNAAPTIDVSALASPRASNAPSIDMSAFDVPLTGKQTLPLFGVDDDDGDARTLRPPPADAAAARPTPPQRTTSRGPTPSPATEGSLSPAALDRPRKDERPDSVRERKNVVAPATKSVPPPAPTSVKRSGLAAPVLIALAAAAGILIWKRSTTPSESMAHAEQPATHAAAMPPPLAPVPDVAVAPVEPTAAAAASVAPAPTAADDITFEAVPTKPTAALAPTHETTPAAEAPAPAEKPATATVASTPTPTRATPAATPRSTPTAAPAIKDEPVLPPPGKPAEPAGPFDRAAAANALTTSAAQASACRKEGDPSGVASVVITFAPSGRVTSANVSGPPFAGTPTGGCIAAALRRAHVPAFEGERVTVSKTIVIQ